MFGVTSKYSHEKARIRLWSEAAAPSLVLLSLSGRFPEVAAPPLLTDMVQSLFLPLFGALLVTDPAA